MEIQKIINKCSKYFTQLYQVIYYRVFIMQFVFCDDELFFKDELFFIFIRYYITPIISSTDTLNDLKNQVI